MYILSSFLSAALQLKNQPCGEFKAQYLCVGIHTHTTCPWVASWFFPSIIDKSQKATQVRVHTLKIIYPALVLALLYNLTTRDSITLQRFLTLSKGLTVLVECIESYLALLTS